MESRDAVKGKLGGEDRFRRVEKAPSSVQQAMQEKGRGSGPEQNATGGT